MKSYLKENVIRDRDYLDSFKDRICCVCGNNQSTVGHHIRTNAGMSIKAGDNETIPLCWKHHSELHNKGEKLFYDRYSFIWGDDIKLYANNIYQSWKTKGE